MTTIEALEARIKALEDNNERLMNALAAAAEMALSNGMAKAMMPKKMRDDLSAYIQQRKAAQSGQAAQAASN